MNKEYVIADINSILLEKKSRNINGFFIHFGIPFLSFLSKEREEFHRITIKNEYDGQFLVKTEFFSYSDFNFITDFKETSSILPNSITEASTNNKQKGVSMLEKFGVFARKNNQNK
jgi:hypothetical protein